jgi:hypothetical protein
VPGPAVTGAFALALASVALFVAYIGADTLMRVLPRLYPR